MRRSAEVRRAAECMHARDREPSFGLRPRPSLLSSLFGGSGCVHRLVETYDPGELPFLADLLPGVDEAADGARARTSFDEVVSAHLHGAVSGDRMDLQRFLQENPADVVLGRFESD